MNISRIYFLELLRSCLNIDWSCISSVSVGQYWSVMVRVWTDFSFSFDAAVGIWFTLAWCFVQCKSDKAHPHHALSYCLLCSTTIQIIYIVINVHLSLLSHLSLDSTEVLDPVPFPISNNQHPALDHTRLISGHRTSLNSPTFDHANSIQATSIINAHSALIADAIGLSITLSLTLPELVNPLRPLLS